jgi:ubiquitin-protein ligase
MKSSVSKLLKTDIASVLKLYPELETNYSNGKLNSLEGFIDIVDSDLEVRGEFYIRIEIPYNYPHGFPSMRELSRIIPREIDRHIYENGNCCLTILQKQILEARQGISILDFIERYSVPYLANQIYFEQYGNWANGEYLHGNKGIAQFYLEEIQTDSYSEVLKVLAIVLNNSIDRNQMCYCGSKKKFKKCHINLIDGLKLIGRNQLEEDFKIILSL